MLERNAGHCRPMLLQVFLGKDHVTDNYGKGSPGPAAYQYSRGFGKQTLAKHSSAPSYTLGGP